MSGARYPFTAKGAQSGKAAAGGPLFSNPFLPKPPHSVTQMIRRRDPLLKRFHDAEDRMIAEAGKTKPARRSPGLDIFIGGAGDRTYSHNTLDYSTQHQKRSGRPTEYYDHGQIDQIVDAIERATADGGTVNVIGHSWGGTAAYDAARKAGERGYRIDNLVTIDPVGRFADGADGFSPAAVGRWTNVTADPARRDLSDWVAIGGGKPLRLAANQQTANFAERMLAHIWPDLPRRVPTNYADQNLVVDKHHADFAGMMKAGGGEDLLTRPREPYGEAAPPIRDDMETEAWMRSRNRQVRDAR